MKKILFLGNLGGGGKERRMTELIRYLHSIGEYKIWLVTIDDGSIYIDAYEYILECCEERLILDRKGNRINTFIQLWSILKRIKPDIVHDWIGARIDLYLNPLLFYRKFYYIAGYLADGNKDSAIIAPIKQLNYYHADVIVSNSWAGVYSHKAPVKKAKVIYNGFNLDRIPQNFDTEAKKKELGINEMVVSMAARLDDAKDYIMYLNVAKKIQEKRKDITFLVIGRGKNEQSLKAYAKSIGLNNTRFLGFRNDVVQLLMMSNVSLLCSNNEVHAEGVSNSIMESMACGTPVIATNGGGTPEIIEDGVNGYIVSPKDVETMTSRLEQLLDNKNILNNFGEKSKKTIKTKFSIESMVSQYILLYNNNLSDRK